MSDSASRFLDLACLTYSTDDSPMRVKEAVTVLSKDAGLRSYDIYTAAATGSITDVRRFLEDDSTAVHRAGGPREWTPLMYLCYQRVSRHDIGGDQLAVARLLLQSGADPNTHVMWDGTYRFTALTGAIGEGELGIRNQPPHSDAHQLAITLLDAGADPNDSQGLYNSMFSESNHWLQLLLRYGLTPDHVVNWNSKVGTKTLDFLLGHAVREGFTERVRLLLAHGANPDSLNHYNQRTHWENARLSGFSEIEGLLTAAGARTVDFPPREQFRVACFDTDRSTARELLERDPDLINDPSLLHDATANGLRPVVKFLLELGADINAFDRDGSTPLHQAAWRGRDELARFLLERGARATRDRVHGATPVGWAAYGNRQDTLRILIEHCDDILDLTAHGSLDQIRNALNENPNAIRQVDRDGNTAVHYVSNEREDAPEILHLLVSCGADVNATNSRGETKLELARRAGAKHIVEAIREVLRRQT